MKSFKSFKSRSSKAQISFELLIVLAVTTLLVSSILIEFSTQSNDTFVLSNIKAEAVSQITKMNLEQGKDCYVKAMQFKKPEVTLQLSGGCVLSPVQLANAVEENYCKIKPTGDAVVNCGENYEIKII